MKDKKCNCGCSCNSKNSWGLILGLFFAAFHALWAILVASGLAQIFIDWIFKLHMVRPPYVIAPFNIATALLLVIVTFVVGYIVGWVFAAICSAYHSNCSCKK